MPKIELDKNEVRTDLNPEECLLLMLAGLPAILRMSDPAVWTPFVAAMEQVAEKFGADAKKSGTPIAARRKDLTDHECWSVLCGTLSALMQLAPMQNVKRAVQCWMESDVEWDEMHASFSEGAAMANAMMASRGPNVAKA